MSIRAMMIGGAGATKPDAPTGASASVSGAGAASVSFSAPANNGGAAITSYTVTASSGATASGAGSPITVSGLAVPGTYTFTVTATNPAGTSDASGASNSLSFVSAGQATIAPGAYFSVPVGVTSVSYVVIGRGGYNNTTFGSVAAAASGGGGGLSYYNNYPVSPGSSYQNNDTGYGLAFLGSFSMHGANVGQTTNPSNGGVGQSYNGGNAGGWASTYAPQSSPTPGGGGGAAGYAGDGAHGGGTIAPAPSGAGSSGVNSRNNPGGQTGGGGGVGVQGFAASRQYMGGGASYGTDGTGDGYGGNYGGGAGGAGARWDYDAAFGFSGGPSPGIARVMWNATGGSPRTYPNNATDV